METLPIITHQVFNNPIPQVFSNVSKTNSQKDYSLSSDKEVSITLLNQLFPDQKREDKNVKQVKSILGDLTETFSLEELQEIISLSQYLTESWLDMWEKELFDGQTLYELLNGG